MNKSRLAYLISQYPAISHTFILREIRMLRDFNFDISVASINPPDRNVEELTEAEREEATNTYYIKPDGIKGAIKAHFYTLFTQPFNYIGGLLFALRLGQFDLKKILYNLFYFVEAVMIGRWMQRNKLSHLHVHFGMAAATVGLITKRIFPIKYSFTMHGPRDFYDIYGCYLSQKITDADFICCITYFASSQLMMLSSPDCWNKLEVSPLGVDPNTFIPHQFCREPEPFEILCVGRLVPDKGQFILLEAVTYLIAKGYKLRLHLVGDGPDRLTLETKVKQRGLTEQVIFAGAVNQNQILKFYANTDIFVLASFAEGLPVVLMEAMVMEIPCVTTNITGVPELIEHGVNGLLVAPSDVNDLAQSIAKLMDEPDLRQQMGIAASQKVKKHYELQQNTKRLADIFRKRL
ncbi:glycosyltransferase family 4 protein [Candidatus Halobeggiatoa sp. HSG11]|nr:glycosyltransferase family 4 protein [Candidatus Halobeggiatoa sp. HSG11]